VIVDAHHHLWDPAIRDYPWMATSALDPIRRPYTVDDLRAAAGPDVVATVLVQTVSSAEETEEFLDVARASAGYVAGVVGWADLTAPGLSIADDPLLVGLRHQVEDEDDPDWLLRDDVMRSLAELGRRGLVYDLLVRAPQWAAALSCARALGEVCFVLDHAGKPGIASGEWEPWAGWLEQLAACPNVVCKLSGLVTEAHPDNWNASTLRPYAEHLLDCFGAERVLFGSDWPVCELVGSHAEVRTVTDELLAGASANESAAVLSGNARRIYRLTG
jgi:L-fucono-1,5-lactonase